MKVTPKDMDCLVSLRRVLSRMQEEAKQTVVKLFPTGVDHEGKPVTASEWCFKYGVLDMARKSLMREVTLGRIDRLIKLGKLEARPSDGFGQEVRLAKEA